MRFDSALTAYVEIVNSFPESIYTNKSLYAAGWIYENILFKPDSAYAYYALLIAKSPASEQAVLIIQKVDEYAAFLNINKDTSNVKDSVNTNDSLAVKDSSEIKQKMPEEKEGLIQKEIKDETEKGVDGEEPPMIKEEKDDGSNEKK